MNYKLKENRNPYDIHVYFTNQEQRELTLKFHARLIERFPWLRSHSIWDRPIGPHPLPMWECDFANAANSAKHGEVCQWLQENVDGFTVLVHPNSNDGHYKDHTVHAKWFGPSLPMPLIL